MSVIGIRIFIIGPSHLEQQMTTFLVIATLTNAVYVRLYPEIERADYYFSNFPHIHRLGRNC